MQPRAELLDDVQAASARLSRLRQDAPRVLETNPFVVNFHHGGFVFPTQDDLDGRRAVLDRIREELRNDQRGGLHVGAFGSLLAEFSKEGLPDPAGLKRESGVDLPVHMGRVPNYARSVLETGCSAVPQALLGRLAINGAGRRPPQAEKCRHREAGG